MIQLILGSTVFLTVAYLMSENKRHVNWRLVFTAFASQFVLAFLLLKVPLFYKGVEGVANACVATMQYTQEGSKFLFGSLVNSNKSWGFIFAFQVLPSIIFFSALTTVLYYLGVLQFVVKICSWVLCKLMPLSGRESLAMAANVFLGQTEAPLLVKPYISKMSRSEIMCLMTGGMATIAGAVMVAYIALLGGSDPAQQVLFGTHFLTASLVSAPAAIMFSKLMVPETERIDSSLEMGSEKVGTNAMDALCNGTQSGLQLALSIGAILLVSVAVVAMLNAGLGWVGSHTGLDSVIASVSSGAYQTTSLQSLLGLVLRPVAWLIGIPWNETMQVGQLLGEKSVLNEFVGYLSLASMKEAGTLSGNSVIISTYALCGFTNLASIGIQITGIGIMAPSQRSNLCSLGFKAFVAASLACLSTAVVAASMISLDSITFTLSPLGIAGVGIVFWTLLGVKLPSLQKMPVLAGPYIWGRLLLAKLR